MPDTSGRDAWDEEGDEEEDDDLPGLVQWIDTRIELGRDAQPIPDGGGVNPISQQVGGGNPASTLWPVLAGCGRRALAKAVDAMVVGGILAWGIWFWLRRFSGEELLAWTLLLLVFGIFVAWGVWLAYHLMLAGDTIGKRLCGIRVVDERARPIGLGRALGRVLGETVSAGLLGFGYLFAFLDGQNRSLHDHLCGTRVVLRRGSSGRR